MALYRFSAGVIARSAGHSSTAAAAYRAGERLTDERTGQTHDYTRRTGVLWTGIYAPKNAPEWTQDRSQLWNAAEKAEKRKDAQTAREFIVCIPHELDPEQGRRLVGDFLRENFARKGFVADAAIHAPGKGGDERNTHAHFLVTMRQVDGQGFAATKDRTQNEKATLQGWRENWARLGNRHLERAGHAGTLDHRSYEDQGIQRAAGTHVGKAAKNMQRRGIPTEAAERQKAFEARAEEIADLRAELAKLEATPDRASRPAEPANDPSKARDRPANDNAVDPTREAAPAILKAAAPIGTDPAAPLGLAPVPDRPPRSAPPPAVPIEQTLAPSTPPPAVAEPPPRAEDAPVRVEVPPPASKAPELPSGPAPVKATPVRPPKAAGQKTTTQPRPHAQQAPGLFRELFTAAAGWTQRVYAKARVALHHRRSEIPPASVDRQRPRSVPASSERPPAQPDARSSPVAAVSPRHRELHQPPKTPMPEPRPDAAVETSRSAAGPAPYRLTTAELAGLLDRQRRERDRDGPER